MYEFSQDPERLPCARWQFWYPDRAFCGNLGIGATRGCSFCVSFPRTPKGSRVHGGSVCLLYRCFSLVTASFSFRPEGAERAFGFPELKMSWFYKGFNKEKCRFMRALKTGFSSIGRGEGVGVFGPSSFDDFVDSQNWGTQTASWAARA